MKQEMKDSQNGIMIGQDANGSEIKINTNELKKRISSLEQMFKNLDSDMQRCERLCNAYRNDFDDFKENVYDDDEYAPIYMGLKNKILQLYEIILDKEKIIKLQQRQLDLKEQGSCY
jgi:SMC interacting uncharacterized protein involved in chromosome segregation